MSNILDHEIIVDASRTRSHLVPGSHLWAEQQGTVVIDGEQWPAVLLLYAAPKVDKLEDGDIESHGKEHDFYLIHNANGREWNDTDLYFSSSFGNLTIDPIGECECCT